MDGAEVPGCFREVDWRDEYRTSAIRPDDVVTDILREFYVPVLSRAVRYDRVAGYFRSSSLAAASQGFSAFARTGAKARFLVGCDLDEKDVEAALRGAEEGLVTRLEAELDASGSWDPATTRGVDLLAFLLAKGQLEIRVALRVHAVTGKPISVASVEDGYVHEKWAVFEDARGDLLHIAGSLNESKTALVINAENISLTCSWWDARAAKKSQEAKADFEHLWKYGSPAIRVLPLPAAVRERLVRMGEKVLEPAEIDEPTPPPPVVEEPRLPPLERLRWLLLRDAPYLPGGQYLGIETAPIEPWPHQKFVARRLVDAWPLGFLLADEVGLGKTIEAGLAIRALRLTGAIRRVLVAAPASLTRQWQRELSSKFLLDFARPAPRGGQMRHERLDDEGEPYETQEGGMLDPELVVASTGLLTHAGRAAEVRQAKGWDFALVDEAHYARAARGRNQLYRYIEDFLRPKARSLHLATATPMQMEMQEAFDLMRLTGRVGSFGADDDITREYYEALREFVQRGFAIPERTLGLLRRAVAEIRHLDPEYWRFVLSSLRESDRRRIERWVERDDRLSPSDKKILARVFRLAAPLSRVMLRHTRGLLRLYQASGQLTANLAERRVRPLEPIQFSEDERRVYDLLEAYCAGLDQRLAQAKTGAEARRRAAAVGFYLSFLRLRFASSLHAIRQTLSRRLVKVEATLRDLREPRRAALGVAPEDLEDALFVEDNEDDEIAVDAILEGRTEADLRWEREALQELRESLAHLSGVPSKLRRLLRELDDRRRGDRIDQIVVFTRFKDTLDHLVEQVRARMPSARIGTFSGAGGARVDPESGDMLKASRTRITQAFVEGEIDVLLCTDAAAEGLNLQTADLLVNFDLPWNPAKVEQRIGRIDRIGQRHAIIQVANYAYAGSAEERVYGRLLSRLEEANLIVGSQQIALLPVDENDFRILAAAGVNEEQLRAIEHRATEALRKAQAANEALEIPAADLQEIYRGWEKSHGFVAPATLADVDGALRLAAQTLPDVLVEDEEGVVRVRKAGAPDQPLTARRDVYASLPDARREEVHFASWGSAEFDRLATTLAGHQEDEPWVRRVEASVEEPFLVKRVAYLVCTTEGVREISSLRDLDGLALDVEGEVSLNRSEATRTRLQAEVSRIARARQAAQTVIELNTRAGQDQRRLSCEIAASYLERRREPSPEDAHRILRDELIPQRRDGMKVIVSRSRLAAISPLLEDTAGRDVGAQDVDLTISPPQLRAAEQKLERAIAAGRERGVASKDWVRDHLRSIGA